nr:unnamed protein product [Callosobruchus analis]
MDAVKMAKERRGRRVTTQGGKRGLVEVESGRKLESWAYRTDKLNPGAMSECDGWMDSRRMSGTKCRKCLNSFHPACLEQAAEQKNVQCSHEAVKVRKTSECLVPEELTENELLRTLVKELQSKNQILEETASFFEKRPITQKGLNEFYNLLEGVSWDFINSDALNIEQKFEKFMKILEDAYLCCFPEKKYIVRSDQGNNITWFNQELREMREHLTLLGDMKNNCYTSTREYRNFRALYRQRIKQAKIIANDNLILRSNNSVKTMWHIINTQRGKPKNSSVESNLSPDEFNTFFSNIADNIVKQIPIPGIDYKHYLSLITPPLEGFSFSEMTFNDVRAVIDRLKNKKSCDLFGFNTKLIKTVKNIILIPLTKLINSCFREKKFPELLKRQL